MTPDQIAARSAAAFDAAVAAGRDLGLEVTDARVLYDVFSVIVHLAPSPVVVRVPTVLPPHTDLDAQDARQRTELDVAGWLADAGHPVIPPSPLVGREPMRRNGFSMTFWQFVEQDHTVEPDFTRNSRLTVGLHAALRDYPGELPFLDTAEPIMVTQGLAALETRPDLLDPADLDRARAEWRALEPVISTRAGFEAAFPGVEFQPIHGDCPPYNIVTTVDGELYSDFELVTFGPVEWDLAMLGPDCEAAYNEAARRRGLRELDDRVQQVVNAVANLRLIACLALVPQLPLLAEGLKPGIDQWRAGSREWLEV